MGTDRSWRVGADGEVRVAEVITVNTKHHRAGRLELDGDELVVNDRVTEYVRKGPGWRRCAQASCCARRSR